MLGQLRELDWKDVTNWVPAILTLVLIPMTFNVALGIGIGYMTYCLLKLLTAKMNEVHWFSWILALFFLAKFILFPSS